MPLEYKLLWIWTLYEWSHNSAVVFSFLPFYWISTPQLEFINFYTVYFISILKSASAWESSFISTYTHGKEEREEWMKRNSCRVLWPFEEISMMWLANTKIKTRELFLPYMSCTQNHFEIEGTGEIDKEIIKLTYALDLCCSSFLSA